MALIEATNIEKTYSDGTRAIRGVSLSIEEGEFVAIMGPSGSGKSTLLHMIGLLDNPTAGKYVLNGKDTAKFPRPELAHLRNKEMGFVFQTFNLLGRTSSLENVKLPLIYSQVPEIEWNERARNGLEAVGLSHREEHEPGQLSGGERQRVAIARALVTNPNIIFADEPTGNLDSVAGEDIIALLQKLNDDGRTVVLITHESEMAAYAKRIVTIKDGLVFSDVDVKNRKLKKNDN